MHYVKIEQLRIRNRAIREIGLPLSLLVYNEFMSGLDTSFLLKILYSIHAIDCDDNILFAIHDV